MRIIKKLLIALVVILILLAIAAWWVVRGVPAKLPFDKVTGTDPELYEPQPQTIPTVQIAKPVGWKAKEKPVAAKGLEVTRFAEGLVHPRNMLALPNGDIIVAESNAPARIVTGGGGIQGSITNFIAGLLFAQAGADVPSPNKLVLLQDKDGDGIAETRSVLRSDLDSPAGLAWRDGKLYVANHNAVLQFDYALGAAAIGGTAKKLMDLPGAGNHWSRNLLLNDDGTLLYVSVGSSSNIADGGMQLEQGRAQIDEYNLATGKWVPFAAGLRNPNGLAWNPWTDELWTTVNERDQLGSDLVPDYLTNVPVGAQYGWPWLYWGKNIDDRVKWPMPNYLSEYSRKPVYAMGPHVAALGLTFTGAGNRMGADFGQGAFIARHGSWNRKPASGYDVVFVNFDKLGNPTGKPVEVLSGFLNADGTTKGRPSWVAWDKTGALLVSDDTGGIIWRVIAPGAPANPAIVKQKIETPKSYKGLLPPQPGAMPISG